MKYTALKLSATKEYNPTKSGFETEDLAWDYIAEHRCDICRVEMTDIRTGEKITVKANIPK